MKTGKPAKGISDVSVSVFVVVDQVVRDLMSTRCKAALGAPGRADTELGSSQVGPVADEVGLVPQRVRDKLRLAGIVIN